MRHVLMPILCTLLLAMLAACESSSAGDDVARMAMPDGASRCTNCGWIEAKRELGPQAEEPGAALSYEYTVRMADGSLSVFRQEPAVHWRVGERLMIIAGEAGLRRARSAGSR